MNFLTQTIVYLKTYSYFCKQKVDLQYNLAIMALAIREIPILTGQSAIDFINEADKYAERPVPHLTQQREMELRSIKEAHKHFVW